MYLLAFGWIALLLARSTSNDPILIGIGVSFCLAGLFAFMFVISDNNLFLKVEEMEREIIRWSEESKKLELYIEVIKKLAVRKIGVSREDIIKEYEKLKK